MPDKPPSRRRYINSRD